MLRDCSTPLCFCDVITRYRIHKLKHPTTVANAKNKECVSLQKYYIAARLRRHVTGELSAQKSINYKRREALETVTKLSAYSTHQ